MKKTGKCPKCGSSEIIANAKAIDRGDYNVQRDLTVATFEDPDAILFKGQLTAKVSAWVCADCGFVEFYAASPETLKVPKQKE